jgi:hypothetical protein
VWSTHRDSISLSPHRNPIRTGRVPHVPPDFLSSFLALVNLMRLSLLKAAPTVVGWSHVQEIRVAYLPRLAVGAYVGRKRRAEPTIVFATSTSKSRLGQESGRSTSEASLDAKFWSCIRARLYMSRTYPAAGFSAA